MGATLAAVAVVGASVACLGGVAAEATTGNGCHCIPPPTAFIPNRIGHAFQGRYRLALAPREAKLTGAQLDIAHIDEGTSFYFGQLALRTYSSSGAPTTAVLVLYGFVFHKDSDRLTVPLILPDSVTVEHKDGESVGQISFAVPGGQSGLANHGHELDQLTDTLLTLNGRGTYRLTFARTSESPGDHSVPPPVLYGR